MNDVAGVEELQAASNIQQAKHGGRLRMGGEGEAAGQRLGKVHGGWLQNQISHFMRGQAGGCAAWLAALSGAASRKPAGSPHSTQPPTPQLTMSRPSVPSSSPLLSAPARLPRSAYSLTIHTSYMLQGSQQGWGLLLGGRCDASRRQDSVHALALPNSVPADDTCRQWLDRQPLASQELTRAPAQLPVP